MGVILLPGSNASLAAVPPNLTNPSCVGTVGNLQPPNYNPYTSGMSNFLGTNSSYPLTFNQNTTLAQVAQWCPWNLQVSSSTGPSGDVYISPDGDLNRPAFDPCYSACSKWNLAQDCCTGSYGTPQTCKPSQYSQSAKAVCPDAYSYGLLSSVRASLRALTVSIAFDDQTSTFIIPTGSGFEVVFCPGGRSTNIIASSNGKLTQLAQQARVERDWLDESIPTDATSTTTIQPIRQASSATSTHPAKLGTVVLLSVFVSFLLAYYCAVL